MNFSSQRPPEPALHIESLQEFYSATLEYYDELFPLKDETVKFFVNMQKEYQETSNVEPVPLYRMLTIGCATGNLENKLSNYNMDITGIDKNPTMIDTAKRRMKRGFSNIRFFDMAAIDMNRFLKKGSFNVICCIQNMLPYISDETLLKKFFHDAHELLGPGGKFIVQTENFDRFNLSQETKLPDQKSVRVTLERHYIPAEAGLLTLDAVLELGSGRKIILQKSTRLFPVTSEKIEAFAKGAGFTNFEHLADFEGKKWTPDAPESLYIFS